MGYPGHSLSDFDHGSRAFIGGIRSDTGEELIDSAGADKGARDSSTDALGLSLNRQGLLVKQL
jgi:hypothetical protein